jgi:DNA polymerase III subunit beta
MKGSFLQKNLLAGINKVSHLAGSEKSSLPILGNILLRAEKGLLTFISTNLEAAIETSIRGKIEEVGSFTVPASLLGSHLNFITSETISFEVKNGELIVEHQNGQTKIKGLSSDDFPIIPTIERKNGLQVSGQKMKKSLQQVIVACSNAEVRPEISGVLFYQKDNDLILVGTDSYRLAEKILKIKNKIGGKEENIKTIVPAKTCQELLKIIEDEDLEIFFSEGQILFSQGPTSLISRVIQAEFPNYQEIIPSDFKTRANVNLESLIKTIRGVSPFSKIGVNDVSVEFLPEKGKLVVSSLNAQTGEAKLEVKADVFGKKAILSFNYRYILEGLSNLEGEEVSLKLIDESSPAILQSSNSQDFTYLLMPIKS